MFQRLSDPGQTGLTNYYIIQLAVDDKYEKLLHEAEEKLKEDQFNAEKGRFMSLLAELKLFCVQIIKRLYAIETPK